MGQPLDPREVARHGGQLPRTRRGKRSGTSSAEAHRQLNAPIRPEHVPGVRRVLREHGYDVAESGPISDRLVRAWKNYRRSVHYGFGKGRGTGDSAQPGALKPAQWNKRNPYSGQGKGPIDSSGARSEMIAGGSKRARRDFVAATNRKVNVKAKAKGHAGNVGGKGGGKGGKGGGGGGGGSAAGLLGGSPGVNKTLGTSMAETLAGAQFDPQIREAILQQQRAGRDSSQALADIGNWEGQVAASQETARQRDVAAGGAARDDVAKVIAGLQASLGGGRGAGVLAASGASDLTSIAQQGQAQDTFNADLAPILAAQKASDLARQRALGSQEQDKLGAAVIDLRGQRGQAKTKALMDILQYNNQARQQNFGNQLALQNAALAASSLGLKASETAAQLKAMGLQNRINTAKLNAEKKQAYPHADWAALQPDQKAAVMKDVLDKAQGELPAGAPYDPGHILNSALQYLRGYGYGSARKLGKKVPNRRNQSEILQYLHREITRRGQTYGQ